jgi:hypothetical protein
MTGYYLHNLETSRIELHFPKSEYDALSQPEKDRIKRAFLWSGKANAWVSRATRSLYQPVQIAKAFGLENQGWEGERVPYGERIEAEAAGAAERAERYAERAQRADEEAEAAFRASQDAVRHIPPGQPILVGHHSEKRHRRDLERCDNAMRRACEATEKAQHYRHRMAAAEHTANQDQTPAFCQRRIEEAETQLRDLARRQARLASQEQSPANIRHGEFLTERQAEEEEKRAYWQERLAEKGGVVYSRANIRKGDLVRIRRQWRLVITANQKTVSVTTGYTWTDRYPYAEITDHRSPAPPAAPGEGEQDQAHPQPTDACL